MAKGLLARERERERERKEKEKERERRMGPRRGSRASSRTQGGDRRWWESNWRMSPRRDLCAWLPPYSEDKFFQNLERLALPPDFGF